MNDQVRDGLVQLVRERGLEAVTGDAQRCRAMLRDLFPDDRAEVAVLVAALEEGVVAQLAQSPDPAMRVEPLAQRLVSERGLALASSQWAVRSWSAAVHPDTGLGPGTQRGSDPDPEQPPEPEPEQPRQPAPQRWPGSPHVNRLVATGAVALIASILSWQGVSYLMSDNLGFGGAVLEALGRVWTRPGLGFGVRLGIHATFLAPWVALGIAASAVAAAAGRGTAWCRVGGAMAVALAVLAVLQFSFFRPFEGAGVFELPVSAGRTVLPLMAAAVLGFWACTRGTSDPPPHERRSPVAGGPGSEQV